MLLSSYGYGILMLHAYMAGIRVSRNLQINVQGNLVMCSQFDNIRLACYRASRAL